MHILVLDTIHGGKAISDAFAARGDEVDLVDVYRGESAVDVKTGRVTASTQLGPLINLVSSAP